MNHANYRVGLYCRLSKDDISRGESISIGTQRSILMDYCAANDLPVHKVYTDDGYSGTNFNRPGFQEMLADAEDGEINMIIVKDLSRLGRDYIMTGYYLELYFPDRGIRFVALSDGYDSTNGNNDIAPFKNILNDMYARDLSKKIRNAKHQRAKQGLFIGSQTPFGYERHPDQPTRLIVDSDAAETVKTIFSLAESGLGAVAIATELKKRLIVAPSVYKFQRGDTRFSRYPAIERGCIYDWCPATIGQILNNRVYTGELISLKTEVLNHKTKQRRNVPPEQQIVTPHAHEAIISTEQFEAVQQQRAKHRCPANARRFNMFRDLLYCSCCGRPLTISRRTAVDYETDMYLCMYHYKHPEICPQTHRVYHDPLYSYVLQQIRTLAKSMKRKKINSAIAAYVDIEELTPEILGNTIARIEIGHFSRKTRPSQGITIMWKLN